MRKHARLFLFGLLAPAPFAALAATAENPVARPNIVLINADDLGWAEIGCFGQQKIKTPNLDRMAEEGERFTQFYSGAATCAPSRNALLTGRHTGGVEVKDLMRYTELLNLRAGKRIASENNRDFGSLKGDYPISDKSYTLHAALKKIGYDTAAFGKWGLGEYGTSGAPDRHGVGTFYGYTDHVMCHTLYPPFLWENGRKDVINTPGIPGHGHLKAGPVDDSKYAGQKHASKAILEHALRYVDERGADGKPFFLYYAPCEPHVAIQPPAEWVDRYPKEWDTKPYLGDRGYLPHSRPRAAYAATISFLDHNVGLLLERLKATGLDKNTLVIFTSDNGTTHDAGGVDHKFFNSTANLSGLKGDNGEGGLRVPFIVRWPGHVPAGKTVAQPAYGPDIMPTLCALTGADAGNPTGENILPVVIGDKDRLGARRPMLWTGGAYGGQATVRIGDLKVTRRNLFANKAGVAAPKNFEVYDLSKDMEERHDIAPANREVIEAAKRVFAAEYEPSPDFPKLGFGAPEKVGTSGLSGEKSTPPRP